MAELIDLKELEERVILIAVNVGDERETSASLDDIFMPVLSIFTGKIDFSNMFIALDGNKYPTLEAAKEVTATINYGSFITQTINFLLMALVVFLVVKAISRLEKIGKQPEAPKAPTEKKCPYCSTMIPLSAVRCPHCTSNLDEQEK